MTNNAKYQIDADQIGIVGDHAHIEGGLHFHTHTSPTGKPLQRPPRATHFTNREQELAQLLSDLQPGRVATLCGPGGIGKSALATEAVWQLASGDEPPDRFPDGIIFHSFYNQPQAALALESIARTFGEEPKPTPRDAAQRVLANRHALLLLDGTEDADDLPTVLDVAGSCGVLVTSRSRKDAVAERQDIKPLPTDEAVTLLRKWGREQAADTEAAGAICKLVGRLPLAVRLVGRYLAETGETATEYLTWLVETPLTALDQGQRRLDSVPVLLERSLARVSNETRQVLSVVGLLAFVPFGREPIAAALDLTTNQLRQPLGELVSYGLLLRSGDRYEVGHALIHTYARRRMAAPDEVVGRLADYYIALAIEQSKLGLEGYARLDAERIHLMAVLVACTEQKAWELVQNLVWAVSDYLEIQGHWIERITAIKSGLVAARELGYLKNEGTFLGALGSTYYLLGQMKQAAECYEQALNIARNIGDRRNEGAWRGALGNIYYNLKEWERAAKYYKQALTIAQEIGNKYDEMTHLGNLGNINRTLERLEQAIKYHKQAQVIAREINDERREAQILVNLGNDYRALGQVEQAIEVYKQAIVISSKVGDRRAEGTLLANLGNTYRNLGQVEQARQYLQQSLTVFEDIKSPDAVRVRHELAEIENA